MIVLKKVNTSNKNTLYILITLAMFAGMIYLLYGYFISNKKTTTLNTPTVSTNIVANPSAPTMPAPGKSAPISGLDANASMKNVLNVDLFNDPKFRVLESNYIEKKEPNIGKRNPFEP